MALCFAATGVAFIILERVWPERPRDPYFVRARANDWAWWPMSAFVTGNLTRILVLGLVGAALLSTGYHGELRNLPAWLASRPSWGIGRLSIPLQVAVVLALGDLVNYWNHRLRHTRLLWPLHSIHHSPTRLDWLSSVRMHPLDDAIDNVLVGAVVLACGARLEVWLATGPFLLFFDAWLHANISWRLGPLEYFLATPAFHRWHHAWERGARACNFAGVLPLWDIVFGTFHLPAVGPSAFGTGDDRVPKDLMGQLAFPFRRRV